MQIILFASPGTRRRLRSMIESCGDEVTAEGSTDSEILQVLSEVSPDLLVLDPDLGFQSATQIARLACRQSPVIVAFLSPSDDNVRDVRHDLQPIGFLPRAFDREDVGLFLAGARSKGEALAPSAAAHKAHTSGGPGDTRLELVSLVSMLLAVAIGYYLPDGLPIFERAGHKAYYIVIGLALISIACLLSARRPLTAGAQVGLVALVTILPTQ